jgi:hypothetical protein
MPVGRKRFITDRGTYFRDYYIKHKYEYLERYRQKRDQIKIDRDYYTAYYKEWVETEKKMKLIKS